MYKVKYIQILIFAFIIIKLKTRIADRKVKEKETREQNITRKKILKIRIKKHILKRANHNPYYLLYLLLSSIYALFCFLKFSRL